MRFPAVQADAMRSCRPGGGRGSSDVLLLISTVLEVAATGTVGKGTSTLAGAHKKG